MIRAEYVDGKIVLLTDEDVIEVQRKFSEGQIILNGDNCPGLDEVIDRFSARLLEQNREAYEALARYD